MERSGGRRALLRGEGLSDTEPREGKFHGGHRGAESVGGGAFLLRDGLLGFTLLAARGCVLAGVGGCGGCGGHWVRGISLKMGGWKAGPRMLVAARVWKIPLAGDGFGGLRRPNSHRGDR
jgi:hypothetical protein